MLILYLAPEISIAYEEFDQVLGYGKKNLVVFKQLLRTRTSNPAWAPSMSVRYTISLELIKEIKFIKKSLLGLIGCLNFEKKFSKYINNNFLTKFQTTCLCYPLKF